MKIKLLVLLAVALFISPLVFAQEQGDMRAGIGLAFGTKAGIDDDFSGKGALGFTPSFEYVFVDGMSGNLSYDYFFKSTITAGGTGGGDASIRLSSLNVDYRYYFATGSTAFYGMAGLAFLSSKFEITDPQLGDFSDTSSDTNLQFGAGANFGLSDAMAINTQLKYTFGIEQLVINAGVIFMF